MEDVHQTLAKGAFGVIMIAAGVVTSLGTVEAWLRVGSLCVGIAVGIITFISIWRRMNR